MLQKKNKNQNRCQGFTLVELIVVIVIILILAAVAVPSITRYVQKSKVAKCANQRHELATQFQIMGRCPELQCTLKKTQR
ncbi:MAG: prepilin-type N-terminal cleavage/methylation domain-containing protein [Lachnospira eligens]